MSNFKMKFVIMVICILSTTLTYSAPEIVYRVDSRPPDIVFKDGFNSWGSNDDLLQHVAGDNTGAATTRDSIFIATTADDNEIAYFLKYMGQSNPNDNIYLYEIYTDNNFYSISNTLKSIFENPTNYTAKTVTLAHNLYNNIGFKGEWVAKSRIDPVNIIRASSFKWDPSSNIAKLISETYNKSSKKPKKPATDAPYKFVPEIEINNYYYIKEGKCHIIDPGFCPINNVDTRSSEASCGVIYSNPYDKPIASCSNFVAINLLLNSFTPKPWDLSGFPFSTYMTCYSGGILAYDHLSCTDAQGVDFEGNLGGFGGLSAFSGTMSFNKGYKYFKGKSCSVSYNDYFVYAVLDINCGNGLNAHLEDISSPSFIVSGGSGSFS